MAPTTGLLSIVPGAEAAGALAEPVTEASAELSPPESSEAPSAFSCPKTKEGIIKAKYKSLVIFDVFIRYVFYMMI